MFVRYHSVVRPSIAALCATVLLAATGGTAAQAAILIDRPPQPFSVNGGALIADLGSTRYNVMYDDIDFTTDVVLTKFSWWGTHLYTTPGQPAPPGDPAPGSITLTIQEIFDDGRPDPDKILFQTTASPVRTESANRPSNDLYTYDFGQGLQLKAGVYYAVSLTTRNVLVWSLSNSNDYKGWYDRACIDASVAQGCTLISTSRGFRTNLVNMAVRYEGTAVPEPSSWALLILGFGLTGTSLRLRRRLQARTHACDYRFGTE